eukprot:TRINITY_DN77741_c0_g1_i1.p1 TRINITY_DN77741_c0_g1~~TRINITY_DN77741_c0_g1_i1.p1  ORF type:complete len:103 (+),score=8.53 TRINITY_DN77741_c0_g1_i1:38-310(+)
MRRTICENSGIEILLSTLKDSLKMQVVADEQYVPGQNFNESYRNELQAYILGVFSVLLVDKQCRQRLLSIEGDLATMLPMCVMSSSETTR